MPARTRAVFIFLIGLALLIAVAASYMLMQSRGPQRATVEAKFALTDQDGKKVTEGDFRGRAMLVFFGFTNCPDVCPLTLQKIADALAEAPALKGKVVPIFISVDPERDTPEKMKAYANYFSPEIRALTGSEAEIKATLSAFKAYARKVPQPDSALGYSMDHSSFIYLYGADGQFVTAFDPGMDTDKLAAALQQNVN
jgi:protein SCO1/2